MSKQNKSTIYLLHVIAPSKYFKKYALVAHIHDTEPNGTLILVKVTKTEKLLALQLKGLITLISTIDEHSDVEAKLSEFLGRYDLDHSGHVRAVLTEIAKELEELK